MLKKTILILFLCIFSVQSYSKENPRWMNKSGWKNIGLYAAMNGGTEKDLTGVTPNTYGAYWAGRLTKFYWDKQKSRITKVQIRVNWTSDRGEPCGKIVTMPTNGYKDFNFRSPAMKKCK